MKLRTLFALLALCRWVQGRGEHKLVIQGG